MGDLVRRPWRSYNNFGAAAGSVDTQLKLTLYSARTPRAQIADGRVASTRVVEPYAPRPIILELVMRRWLPMSGIHGRRDLFTLMMRSNERPEHRRVAVLSGILVPVFWNFPSGRWMRRPVAR